MAERPLRDHLSPSGDLPLLVEQACPGRCVVRDLPSRSEGARPDDEAEHKWTSGTFRTAAKRLPAIAGMGFDVVYLTPIHPIGSAAKGPQQHPQRGTGRPRIALCDRLRRRRSRRAAPRPRGLGRLRLLRRRGRAQRPRGGDGHRPAGLARSPVGAVAPSFFTTRADGTIAYAENPPKKYQDIYPLNFDNDPAAAYAEVRRVMQVWIDCGVKIFRVDNPHTKPVEFWQWLIDDVAKDHPDVIWLAEAFTKPAMMHTLGKVGFQQSYTYYAWRNSAQELQEYVEELAGDAAAYMRPSFWPTTHDILTPYMQFGGPAAWKLRAALAATLVPTYGIYTGYELMEHVARPGAEEQIDNEKYEYKDRNWADYEPGGSRAGARSPVPDSAQRDPALAPSLLWLRNITFHRADDSRVLVFSKRRQVVQPDGSTWDDVILVVANTDPHSTATTMIHLDMPALGYESHEGFIAHDEITGQEWPWYQDNTVILGPSSEPVHIIHVRRYFWIPLRGRRGLGVG